jgi:hypothetical protein
MKKADEGATEIKIGVDNKEAINNINELVS